MNTRKLKRQRRVRGKIEGTTKQPRLSVYRSNRFMYAQLIDDTAKKTIASVYEKTLGQKGTKEERAKAIGLAIAKIAKEKKIIKAVFDRGGYRYHGRVKAVAEGAREGGVAC